MTKYEWDFPPTMRPRRGRRRRPPPILEGEILEPELEREPHIRVSVEHRHVNHRQRQQIPPWLIVLLIIAVVMWISPFGAVVALVMGGILLTAHPTVAIAIGAAIAVLVVASIANRRTGRPF